MSVSFLRDNFLERHAVQSMTPALLYFPLLPFSHLPPSLPFCVRDGAFSSCSSLFFQISVLEVIGRGPQPETTEALKEHQELKVILRSVWK